MRRLMDFQLVFGQALLEISLIRGLMKAEKNESGTEKLFVAVKNHVNALSSHGNDMRRTCQAERRDMYVQRSFFRRQALVQEDRRPLNGNIVDKPLMSTLIRKNHVSMPTDPEAVRLALLLMLTGR